MASRQPHRGASPGPMLRSALVTQARETPRRRAKAARVSPPAAIASAYLRARIRARSLVGTFVACGGRTSTMAISRISRFEKSNAWGAPKPRGKRLGASVFTAAQQKHGDCGVAPRSVAHQRQGHVRCATSSDPNRHSTCRCP